MICWSHRPQSSASVIDGPMNLSAQCRQGPSSTCLPSIRISLQSQDRAPCAVMRFRALDLPPPGSPPSSMLRSARLTWTCSPFSSMPRCTGPNMDSGNTGTAGVIVVVVMVASVQGVGAGRPRADARGAACRESVSARSARGQR